MHCVPARSTFLCFRFHVEASLARIAAHASDVRAMVSQAVSKSLPMTLYVCHRYKHLQSLPMYQLTCCPLICWTDIVHGFCHAFIPPPSWVMEIFFFSSMSYSLYSTESYHALLRLLSVLEALFNCSFYDNAHAEFYAPYKADQWLVLPNYVSFVSALARLNSYCDMLAVLAASSVTQKAIQTLWPVVNSPRNRRHPPPTISLSTANDLLT